MSNNFKTQLDTLILNNPELLQQLKDENAEAALAILLNFARAEHIEPDRETACEWLSTHNEKAKELSLDKLEEVVGGGRGGAVAIRGAKGTAQHEKYAAQQGPQVF